MIWTTSSFDTVKSLEEPWGTWMKEHLVNKLQQLNAGMLQNLLLYHNSTGQKKKSGNWCTDWSTQVINTNNGKYQI